MGEHLGEETLLASKQQGLGRLAGFRLEVTVATEGAQVETMRGSRALRKQERAAVDEADPAKTKGG